MSQFAEDKAAPLRNHACKAVLVIKANQATHW